MTTPYGRRLTDRVQIVVLTMPPVCVDFAALQLLFSVDTLHNTFTQLRRYVKWLLKAIVATLSPSISSSTASQGLMNRVRAIYGG